jgi:hypothetical protein
MSDKSIAKRAVNLKIGGTTFTKTMVIICEKVKLWVKAHRLAFSNLQKGLMTKNYYVCSMWSMTSKTTLVKKFTISSNVKFNLLNNLS